MKKNKNQVWVYTPNLINNLTYLLTINFDIWP